MHILTGCDCQTIAGFAERMKKDSFRRGVYTPEELAYIDGKGRPIQTAAGIYCAKEAAAKALGRGLFGLRPTELEIGHEESGRPYLVLHGSAALQYGHLRSTLSISHSGDTAFAVCNFWEE